MYFFRTQSDICDLLLVQPMIQNPKTHLKKKKKKPSKMRRKSLHLNVQQMFDVFAQSDYWEGF